MKKWINSARSNPNGAVFYYGEQNDNGIISPEGGVNAWDGKRPFWHVGSDNSGTADSVGQAKRAVETLVKMVTE